MKNLESQIEELMQELFAFDRSFKQHEAEVRPLIRQLLLAKPETQFNEQFAAALKKQLMEKIQSLKIQAGEEKKFPWRFAFWPALAVVTLMVGGVFVNSYEKNKSTSVKLISNRTEIEKVGKNAFGKLSLSPVGFGQGGGGGAEGSAAAVPDAGTKTSVPLPESSLPVTEPTVSVISPVRNQSGGGGMGMKIMPAYYNFRYVYKGDALSLDETEVSVYRRQKGLTSSAASQFLKDLKIGLLDLKKFQNRNLDTLSITEDKEYGYNIMVNFKEGVISVNENWELWPTPDKQCKNPECYESLRLKPSDVPGDQEIISIANNFLKDYGVSVANYGQPKINDYWKRELLIASDKTQVYIPDVVSVVYPQIIEGQQVYDEGGSLAGLMVNVNIRVKKATGVNELAVQKYQASNYEAETNADRILKLAESGGYRQVYYTDPEAKTQDVELGTPTKSLVKIWQYKSGGSEELYVPALVFPVITDAKNFQDIPYFYRTSVIIPLAKEILDSENSNGPIQIMK